MVCASSMYGVQSVTGKRGFLEVDHLVALGHGGLFVLVFLLEDGGLVRPAGPEVLDRLGVFLGQGAVPAGLDLGVVDATRVDLQRRIDGLVRDGEGRDLAETTSHADRDRRRVEDEAAADRHEILLAGLVHHLGGVEEPAVVGVDDDVASVNAAGRVAPLGEGVGELGEFYVDILAAPCCWRR